MKITLETLYNNGFVHEDPEDKYSQVIKTTKEYEIRLTPYLVTGSNAIIFDIYAKTFDQNGNIDKELKIETIDDGEKFIKELKKIDINISLKI